MIAARQIRELLDAKPFKPFRICMSDGTHRDTTHHDMAWVTKGTVEVGVNLDADGFRPVPRRIAGGGISSGFSGPYSRDSPYCG